jgi:hypothetical protein
VRNWDDPGIHPNILIRRVKITTIKLNLVNQPGKGKLLNTGDDMILVIRLEGSWYEMGQQLAACHERSLG